VVFVRLDLIGSSQVPYLTTETGKGSIGHSSLFPEEAANTLSGEIIVLIKGSGTNGQGEHLPWCICFVWLVGVRCQGGGTVDASWHPSQLIIGSKGLEVIQCRVVGPGTIATLA
jgi:hypothetical protein